MSSNVLAAYIDTLIPLFAGLWATAVGFGKMKLRTRPNSRSGALVTKLIPHFRWIGPLLLIGTIVRILTIPR